MGVGSSKSLQGSFVFILVPHALAEVLGSRSSQQRNAEQVLLLDADNQPLRNPEPLFDAEAFRSTGGLFWPDWCASSRLTQSAMDMRC